MSYKEQIDHLSPLENFDPDAFIGDGKFPQELCDFVLALALAYNDFRDIVSAQRMVLKVAPANLSTPTPQLGNYGGLIAHLVRLSAGFVHELLNLMAFRQQDQ